ncbi:intermembrane lipid transfer protein VPS13C-like isoform X9 [Biomphalaria glabrata]|uniref:Intermembrane lipid transfer protein VPS13C-like isoform X9 n=1 Tax=Biomphalaria glabrata TaxID=6526 RepID=A0A9W2ZCD5_BIOGL|nr:intermembrane lipid transfer protein VPS13C-like isoform X9 [Biomphalaria glabrata]
MVFETILVEIINRYLGAFVENLDSSQLQIGLWGAILNTQATGDVVLSNLNLKESALDDFDLPVKIKAGHIGKLTLKVPWKNLYTEPVIAQVEGIYALALPNVAIKYDEEKEAKAIQDTKQAALAKIEELKKLEAEKDKPKEPKNDSFVEKFATQVIKNLQVRISNIHIRYEDKYSNPSRPFAMGFTLSELLFHTTDSNWKETVIKEAVTQIFKLVRLDSLSVYWNSKDRLIQDLDRKVILDSLQELFQGKLQDNIAKQGTKPHLQYLFKPISAVAHLRLNTKPELTDFTLPKIFLTLVFDEIAVGLSKDQYDDILELLEAIERMSLMARYKKTRPDKPYKGNAKLWWVHAYSAVLEHTVRRRRKMWSWQNMKRHRMIVREYKDLYTVKLDSKNKITVKQQERLKKLEEDLDVFNISLCRNQAEVNVVKLGKKREEEGSRGWFGGWFGGGKKKEQAKHSSGKEGDLEQLGDKFQEEFTTEEKAKLYSAIGYDENAKDPTYPEEFVAVRLVTKLNKLSLTLMEKKKIPAQSQLLKLSLSEICASFGQRPAANAIRLDLKVDKLRVTGAPRKDYTPRLISSFGVATGEDVSLLTVTFETNPPDKLCDSRVKVHFRPLEIIYDAISVNGMSSFFTPPESVRLKQLSNAAMAKYDDIKAQTAAGVMYLAEQRKYADIDIMMMPSYIIVPETGEFRKDVNMLLLNLGQLTVKSEKTQEITKDIKDLSPMELTDIAYDKFHLKLDNLQLLFVQPGDDWHEEMAAPMSHLFILRPLSLNLLVEKCIIANDASLPMLKTKVLLPLISLSISDSKLNKIMNLASSIPLPEPGQQEIKDSFNEADLSFFEISSGVEQGFAGIKAHSTTTPDYTNKTQLALTFELHKISIEILETVDKMEVPFLKLIVNNIGLSVKVRSFDMAVQGWLGAVYLQHLQYVVSEGIKEQLKKFEVKTGEMINIINTPFLEDDQYLLYINYLQADKKCPDFATTYQNIAQSITVEFSTLDIILHHGVLISLMQFAQKFQPQEVVPTPKDSFERKSRQSSMTSLGYSTFSNLRDASRVSSSMSKKSVGIEVVMMKLKGVIDSIQLSLCNEMSIVMHSKIEGIELGARKLKDKLGLTAMMRKIELIDPDPKTKYPKIFSVTGGDMLKFEMIQFQNGTEGYKFGDVQNIDLDIYVQLGRARIVFVNKFILSLINFLDNFSIAKTKLDEASKAVKEASKDVAKNIQENAPRIKLDVAIKAPLVVIPKSSRSLEVMMINLGDINIVNKFERRDKTEPAHRAHIMEQLVVMLTNLRLSRGLLINEDGAINWEITILDPITFKVNILRNLSTGWYHGVPDIEIGGLLETINIQLNKDDLALAMNILVGNLKERNPNDLITIQVDSATNIAAKAEVTSLDFKLADSETKTVIHEEVYTSTKLDFKLSSIIVQLYRGRVNMEAGEKTRSSKKMLSQLCLHNLFLAVEMKSDQSLLAKMALVDFTMDDCRAEREGGITKLIRRTAHKNKARETLSSHTTANDSDIFIDLLYKQDAEQNKIVQLQICSIHVCVCLEFIMKVMDFFMSSVPAAPVVVNKQTHSLSVKTKKTEVKPPPPPTVPEKFVGSMDIVVKVAKPEIYMIEDQMNPHTNSLIVDVQLDFRLRINPDVININGSIKELSLVSCIFGQPEKQQSILKKTRLVSFLEKTLLEICYNYYEHTWERLPVLIYVLHPVDIDLMANGPNGKDHHIDVIISDFIFTISPPTIRLITSILNSMYEISPEDVVKPVPKDHSNIWDLKPLDKCDFWFTQSGLKGNKEKGDDSSVEIGQVLEEDDVSDVRGELTSLGNITLMLYKQDVLIELLASYLDMIYHQVLDQFIPLLSYTNLIMNAPVVIIKLEGGIGHRTVPLLMVESSFSCQVHNWTSDLFFESTLSLEIAYNNEKNGVWEPLLEPVVDKSQMHKWELAINMLKNDPIQVVMDEDPFVIPPPKLVINVTASQPLQLIMTKTCLDVLANLSQAFSEAYNLREMEGKLGQKIVPYVFNNETGQKMAMKLDASFKLSENSTSINLNEIPSPSEISVEVTSSKTLAKSSSIIRATQSQEEKRISFMIEGASTMYEMPIKQARKRLFHINNISILASNEVFVGQKIITFSSAVIVKNHLSCLVNVLYKDSHEVKLCGQVFPDQKFCIPINAVYSSTGEIFFQPQPENESYLISKESINVKTYLPEVNGKIVQFSCPVEQLDIGESEIYYFNVMLDLESVYKENTDEMTEKIMTVHLHPNIILHNLLPIDVTYSMEKSSAVLTLPAGQHQALINASVNETTLVLEQPLEITIPNYRGNSWIGKKQVRLGVPELSVWTFETTLPVEEDKKPKKLTMDLGLHCSENSGSFDMTLYCPYWIVNLTSRTIALKEDEKEAPFVQDAEDKEVMLYFFRDKPFFGGNRRKETEAIIRTESSSEKKKEKEKVRELKTPGKVILKIDDSEWSDKFSLDTVGTGGNVMCKHKAGGYITEVGITIKLTSSGLTKVVTFTPFYLLLNASDIPLHVKESEKEDEIILAPEECKHFYPKSSHKEMKIQVRPFDSLKFSTPFHLNKAHTTLLKIIDKYGGLQAECHISESSMITTFHLYKTGMATVLLVNHTSQCVITFRQQGTKDVEVELQPQTSQLYTWSNPTGIREIVWSCGLKKEMKHALDRDHIEEFFAQSDVKVYFVSFLDGLQRVAMFTQDVWLANLAQEAGELEQADQELNLKIHDMGFSLVNNELCLELAYMGITSSGVIWEEKKKKFKAVTIKDNLILEHAYQKYLLDKEMKKSKEGPTVLENKFEVDFDKMILVKPRQAELRRSFADGIWVQMRQSPHSTQLHAKINRLQFDNQLRHAVFPTILSPLPPPRSVAAESIPKPFIEVSLMNKIHEHSNLVQIKYFKVLIQEMNLKVDQGFLSQLLAMFASDILALRDQEPTLFQADVDSTKLSLKEVAGVSIQAQRVSFYDYFHISPIKIHVSFSLQGGSMKDTPQAHIMGVFLQSVGVVLTDVQDVVFKLGYFERNYTFYNNTQLTNEFVRHYSGQAVKQMYVLVLGLDVLGNPFGLLRGLSEGIEDLFYEPYQGAIQGPGEFAEGLALGVRSLFGHAVGGAAGAVSRITGTLGKGLAALTLDDDYQKKRREQLNKRPATASEGFARGGKGLVMGVFDGVTGIVRKPVEGAKQEGVTGFFKGVGKGLVGVVTRPTSGVVDFASSTLEGVRRITDFTDEIHRLRPARRFNKDGIVRPYILEEAEGFNLLRETDKGQYVDTDEYVAHFKVKEDGKTVFIVTDKRILLAKRGELFGTWDSEWMFTYQELKGEPKITNKGLEITLKTEKKKMFGSNVTKKDLHTDLKVAQLILSKIQEVMAMERVESGV